MIGLMLSIGGGGVIFIKRTFQSKVEMIDLISGTSHKVKRFLCEKSI